MKKLNIYSLSALLLLVLTFVGCSEEKMLYSGNEYVMFADTLHYMPVTPNDGKIFDVVVSTTQKANYDRTYGVELVINKSNAIEGRHFELLSNNVTIKAGELTGSIPVKGIYDDIIYGEELVFTLRILASNDAIWDLYGKETKVSLIKCPKFSIDDYTGNLKLYATFPFSTQNVSFYVKSEKLNDSTLLIKQPFSDKYDLKVRFADNKNNPFEDGLSVSEQIAFSDVKYGRVSTQTVVSMPSYYITEARSLFMYMDMFVSGVGSFGTYRYIFKWVPQSEVDAANNSTNTPFMLQDGAFGLSK